MSGHRDGDVPHPHAVPGHRAERRLAAEGRIIHDDWDRYDTRHAVFRPAGMTAEQLEAGYWRAYRDFYRWRSILSARRHQGRPRRDARHLAYAAGWKKFEPLWDLVIRAKRVGTMLPTLERVLSGFGTIEPQQSAPEPVPVTILR